MLPSRRKYLLSFQGEIKANKSNVPEKQLSMHDAELEKENLELNNFILQVKYNGNRLMNLLFQIQSSIIDFLVGPLRVHFKVQTA